MTSISSPLLLEKLFDLFNSVCLLNLPENRLTQLKFPVSSIPELCEQEIPFRESIPGVVHTLVHPSYQTAVLSFLQPERIRDAFVLSTDQEEITFRSNSEQWNKIVIKPLVIRDGQTQQALYLQMDTTPSRRQYESIMRENLELREISERDKLTDLFNRTKLMNMIQSEYSAATSCGVLFFDVNNLKTVNDTQGHDVGDKLLQQVASGLRSVANRSTHAYRYGGDEFIIVAVNCPAEYMDTLVLMCQNRLNTLSRQSGLAIQLAVGKAWRAAPCDPFSLIQEADREMYKNKREMKQE